MKKVVSMLLVLTVICGSLIFSAVPVGASSYNPSAAVDYASKYWSNYNPAYNNYNSVGGDCANFVSQCLYAGGIPQDDVWYNGSSAWINCSYQINYFRNMGYTVIDYAQASDIQVGNPIYYYNGGSMAHTAICIGFSSNGTPLVAAHNKNHWGSEWTLGGPSWWGGSNRRVTILLNGNSDFPGEEDTSWVVGKTYYANSRLDTYNSAGVQESGRWIDAGDDCYVERVYKNGYAWVEYPSGNTRRWAYTLASGFPLEKKGNDPIGVIDSVSGEQGAIHIHGWAFDEDDKNAQLNIHVYIGGGAGDPNAEGHNQTWANKERKDVNNVYGCGDYHGFDDTIPTSKTETQTVYIYAINVGDGSNKYLGEATVNINPDTEKPTIENKYFDQVKSDGFWPCFTVKDNSGILSAKVAVWTQADQSDLIWHDAKNNGYGTYFVDVKRSDYSKERNSIYQIHAYIKDYAGNEAFASLIMDYRINSDTGKNIPEGEYRIATAVNNDKYLDIAGGSTSSGANIQIYANAISPLQTFNLTYNNNGFYKIANTHSNCLVDVVGDTYLNNTNVAQSTENGGANQEWMFKPTGNNDDYYYIIARSNGLALDVTNALDQDGANVAVHTQNQTTAQKWKLRRVLKDNMVTVGDVTIREENETIIPDISVIVDENTLAENTDYQVQINTDIKNGNGTITVTGMNNYCDSITKEFNITVAASVLGDADGDGDISSVDVTYVQRYNALINTGIDEDTLMNADVDGNGELEIIDATWIQRYLAYMDTPFAIGEILT